MKRIIKLTEKQLREVTGDNIFLTNNSTPNYCGQSCISANGKLDQDTYGEPTTTDKVSQSLTPQTYYRYSMGTQLYRKSTNEDKQNQIDDDNNVDSFYDNKELDTMSNGVDNDNLTRIPEGVEYKVNLLLTEIKKSNLSPKQQGIVLNKIIEAFEVDKMPFSWRKTLMLKIKH